MLIREKELKRDKLALVIVVISIVGFVVFTIIWKIITKDDQIIDNTIIPKLFSTNEIKTTKLNIKFNPEILNRADFVSLEGETSDSNLEIGRFGKKNPFEEFPELQEKTVATDE